MDMKIAYLTDRKILILETAISTNVSIKYKLTHIYGMRNMYVYIDIYIFIYILSRLLGYISSTLLVSLFNGLQMDEKTK